MQAAKQPHADLSAAEVEASAHSCEHLLWLSQQSRGVLGSAGAMLDQLATTQAVLAALTAAQVLPPQEHCRAWYQGQRQHLAKLAALTAETSLLLEAAGRAETAVPLRQGLQQGQQAVDGAAAAVHHCLSRLTSASEPTLLLPDGSLLLLPSVLPALSDNARSLYDAWQSLDAFLNTGAAQGGLPGWAAVVAAFAAAAQHSAAAAQQIPGPPTGQGAAPSTGTGQQVGDRVEAAVAAALVWAQQARPVDPGSTEGENGPSPLPELLQQLEGQLALGQAATVCRHVGAALGALAAASSPGEAAGGSAVVVASLAPMLGMLGAALRQLALKYLAVHKAITKLCYITCSLLTGLVQEGFCMPEGTEGGWLSLSMPALSNHSVGRHVTVRICSFSPEMCAFSVSA